MGVKNAIFRIRGWLASPVVKEQRDQYDILLRAEFDRCINSANNPLSRFGAKYFSQADEDGITLEIVRRLGIERGTFAEFGVGNGLENNTLILLANGWRGFWVGGEDLSFNHRLNPKRFSFFKSWVSLENLDSLLDFGLRGIEELDVLSLDLDGNDYYFAKAILEKGIKPKLFILEYNAKFPPPIKWTIKYDAKHIWDVTDYMGASLQLLVDLLGTFDYSLICCNAATGANAFFVRNDFMHLFKDVPKDINDIFVGCRYDTFKGFGHPNSPKTIERMLESNFDVEHIFRKTTDSI
jgi:hypothetical protein